MLFAGLWGLVNNSGVCYVGDLEMMSERIIRKMMDVNLFGAIAVTKSVLHLIRKAHGRIVNVSSMTGTSEVDFFWIFLLSVNIKCHTL